MSLNYLKSIRSLTTVNKITKHYSSVCPLFYHKSLETYCSKSIFSTNQCNHSIVNKVFLSIHSMNYSNISTNSHKCWKCGQQSSQSKVFLICDNCHSIQAIDRSLNYFDLFQQKVSFDLDLNDMNKSFKNLQMSTHPDKYVMSSDRERNYSTQNSILINKAYKTLRNPYERGIYLLKLFNTSVEENQSMGESQIDSQFLSNIMELNEDIEENCESKEKLLNFFNDNKQKMNELMDQLSDAFKSSQIIRAKELLKGCPQTEDYSTKRHE